MPRERAEILVHPDGRIDVVIGTLSSGQGHETSFSQLVTELARRSRSKLSASSPMIPTSSRSEAARTPPARCGSPASSSAAPPTRSSLKAKRIAAHIARSGRARHPLRRRAVRQSRHRPSDRPVRGGGGRANAGTDLPDDLRGPLKAECDETVRMCAFPFGCHVCEVEIDAETGAVEIVKYTAVDDVGRAVNPLIVHGQSHGGIAQGVGQALARAMRV